MVHVLRSTRDVPLAAVEISFTSIRACARPGRIFFWTYARPTPQSIIYACAVKNDTPLMGTVGVKVQMVFEP